MGMKEKGYSIHDIITFNIINNNNFLNNLFSNVNIEYINFGTERIDNPDLTIYLGRFSPSNEGCRILDNNYYVKDDYFYCRDTYKSAKWEFEMAGFESGNTVIKISTNPFAAIIITGFLIDPLINFKLNEKGYSLIHGSGVSKGNHAYLFAAQGGGGKTSTALYALEKGFSFLGDNFVILDKGYVLNFLSPLNIFSFNLAPIVKKNMKTASKIEYHLKNLFYKITKLRIVTKINVKDIFHERLDDKSKLESIFLLVPKEKFNISQIDKEEFIKHMVTNMKLDSYPFLKYMMEYSYNFPESTMAKHWDNYEKNLRNNLSNNITIYQVEVPQNYDINTFAEILRVIR